MRRILIVEDEETLRIGMMRALAKLPQVEIVGAGTVAEALAVIDAAPPDAVISDLDLPDRLGAELLGELELRGLRLPVTFVSAYTRELGARVPRSPRVRLLDKPISLERLREVVLAALASRDSELPPPFGAADYLQLACLGRHSVVITHRASETDERPMGRIVVWRGELWSAEDDLGSGEEAFRRIVPRTGVFRCHTLDRDPGPRLIEGGWEMMLLDSIRLADEEGLAELVALGKSPPPSAAVEYEDAFDRGIAALLTRDYPAATRSFAEALAARPADPLATANLERLRALGHVHVEDAEASRCLQPGVEPVAGDVRPVAWEIEESRGVS